MKCLRISLPSQTLHTEACCRVSSLQTTIYIYIYTYVCVLGNGQADPTRPYPTGSLSFALQVVLIA